MNTGIIQKGGFKIRLSKTGGSDLYNLSIVIPTKDRPDDLRRCLSSVVWQLEDMDEIIIVDGGDSEITSNILTTIDEHLGKLRLLSDGTPNFTHAINLGCKAANNSIVGIVNDDIVFSETWVKSAKHWFQELPSASSIGGATQDMNTRKINSIMESSSYIAKLYDKLVVGGRLKETGIITSWGAFSIGQDIPRSPIRVSGFSGANMIVLKSVLEEMGYFKSIFKYAGAEGYFYLQLLEKEREVYLVPGCEVKHYPNPEGGTRNPFYLAQDYAVYFKMIRPHKVIDRIRMLLNILSFFTFWILQYKTDFKKYQNVFRGYVSGLKLYKRYHNHDVIA